MHTSFSLYLVNQGWSRASLSFILRNGFFFSIFLIKSLQSVDIYFQLFPAKEGFSFRILSKISAWLCPIKGGIPVKIVYKITPKLHISHSTPYLPAKTSGAIKNGVPTICCIISESLNFVERPKSIIFISASSDLLVNKKFSGLRSR